MVCLFASCTIVVDLLLSLKQGGSGFRLIHSLVSMKTKSFKTHNDEYKYGSM